MSSKFAFCKCFFQSNIYLKDYDLHVNYVNAAQLNYEYGPRLKHFGCEDARSLIPKINEEIERRKANVKNTIVRKKEIQRNYQRIHPVIFSIQEKFLAPEFLDLIKLCQKSSATEANLKHPFLTRLEKRVYAFPVFTHEFCKMLLEELTHFEQSNMPKERPNSMNKKGVILSELGLDEALLTPLRVNYLQSISKVLFPDWSEDGNLDSHYAFTVAYDVEDMSELGMHFDNSEVTLNVSLNHESNYTDGELFFGPMKNQTDSEYRFGYWHKYCWGILHRGQHMHGAMPITSGERTNLIMWMRASSIRNKQCPLCDQQPQLQPVEEGVGAGFTVV